MAWAEKAGLVEFKTEHYRWSQTREEVYLLVPVPPGTRGRDIDCVIKNNYLKFGFKGKKPLFEGELCKPVKAKESTWTIEDQKEVSILLVKAQEHESWVSVIKGQNEIDPFTKDQMDKKMLLEKFQSEHPGFDFSGANFSGQLPSDPKNFGRFDLANSNKDEPPK
eukprot:TRINITY_DN11111_c0_g1_i1.p1 TRINITY_DN11111_c0_g1~~TRINITY_DN11111_c0_g1_i1.p1  ORF type:complete len:165 (-),score=41.29 TRINITY_DN11111_c0_g1_i1:62-556(-)